VAILGGAQKVRTVDKTFLTFSEAAARLHTDVEGLRQALELGTVDLPVFVRAREKALLGSLRGARHSPEGTAILADGRRVGVDQPFGSDPTVDIDYSSLGDSHADIFLAYMHELKVGSEPRFLPLFSLRGFLRVTVGDLRNAARENSFLGVGVSPPNWWDSSSPVPRGSNGGPAWDFALKEPSSYYLPSTENLADWLPCPSFLDAYIRTGDIDALEARTSATPLDVRERTSLLRVIRALDTIADLPRRGATAAVEARLQTLGFDKPREATIRKILEEARALEPDQKPQ
jgi:hypothetical protein